MRICGDYKVTINEALDVNQYPIPNLTDLFASVANGYGVPFVPKLILIVLFINDVAHLYMGRLIYK